jgi:hypothetical protein
MATDFIVSPRVFDHELHSHFVPALFFFAAPGFGAEWGEQFLAELAGPGRIDSFLPGFVRFVFATKQLIVYTESTFLSRDNVPSVAFATHHVTLLENFLLFQRNERQASRNRRRRLY